MHENEVFIYKWQFKINYYNMMMVKQNFVLITCHSTRLQSSFIPQAKMPKFILSTLPLKIILISKSY